MDECEQDTRNPKMSTKHVQTRHSRHTNATKLKNKNENNSNSFQDLQLII